MQAIIRNGKLKLVNAVDKQKAIQLLEEYAKKYDPNYEKTEVWELHRVKQWLRGTKGFSQADASEIGNIWMKEFGPPANNKTNASPKVQQLAEKAVETLNPSELSESAVVSYALELGMTKAEGQQAWQIIFRDMRSI